MIKRTLIILLMLVPGMFLAYQTYCALHNGAHDFSPEQCGDCHAQTPVQSDRRTLVMRDTIETLCRRCHKPDKNALSHPVGMSPAHAVIPSDFPLSWDGTMTCSTCHDIHAPASETGGKQHYLRREASGQAFCSVCHVRAASGVAAGGGHAQALGVAHMQFSSESFGSLDEASQRCLTCHDGGVAKSVEFGSAAPQPGGMGSSYSSRGNHPVGIKYRSSMVKKGELQLKTMLNPKIKLVGGKVSCISCHDVYVNPQNKYLISTNGGKLCQECHIK